MYRLITAAIASCALGACATVNTMAFDKNAKTIDITQKSVVLLAIDVSRPDGSRHVPNPIVVRTEKPNAQTKEERQNFKLDRETDTVVEDGRTLFLARMALAPGQYRLMDIFGDANAFPFIAAFSVPLLQNLNVTPNSIAYVGRVTAKLRPRQEGEFRAGPLIPLIDQAVSGMSTSTWDIAVDDMYARDVPLFKATYPALAAAIVESSPLPPFDRAAAQRWWDGQETTEQKATAAAAQPAAQPAQLETQAVRAPPGPAPMPPAAPAYVSAPAPMPIPAKAADAPPAPVAAPMPQQQPTPQLQPAVSAAEGQRLAAATAFRGSPRLSTQGRLLPMGTPYKLRGQVTNAEGDWWFIGVGGDIGWIQAQ